MVTFRQRFSELNPWLRGLLYVAGGLLILLLVLQILISLFAEDYLADTLKDQLQTSTGSTYTLDFEDLDLNIFTGSAAISSIRFNADTSAFSDTTNPAQDSPQTLFNGTIDKVEITGANFISALSGDELHLGSITITRPDIAALKNPYKESTSNAGSSFSSVDSTIYEAISGQYKALEISTFTIQDGYGLFKHSGDTLTSLQQLDLRLRNIRVDSSTTQSGRAFITDHISLDTKNFRTKLADSLNIITYGSLSISSEDQTVEMDSLQLVPRYPKIEFGQRHGTPIDRIDLLVPHISFKFVDFSLLIDSSRFYAQHAEINNAHFEDFLNLGLPSGPPKMKPLPFIAFRDLPYQIKIDTLQINEAYIAYSEFWGESSEAGTITFEQVNATFDSISNYPEDIQNGVTTTLTTEARVMGNGLLEANFEFPMNTQIGFHKINGKLNSMPIPDFNRILEDVAYVRANSGSLHHLTFDMTLDEDQANGTLIMEYEGLNISVLDKQTTEQQGLKENITTFVANNFIVRQDNTPETEINPGRIDLERDKSKSIFNYWWKSLLSGIKDSATK